MRIFIKRSFAFPAILFLIFSFISCCCLSGHAEAGIARQQVKSHCDSQDNHSAPNHQCECPKLQGALAANFDALKTADVLLYSLSHQIIPGKIFLTFVLDDHSLSPGSSPPLSVSSIPLYIKNPSLRI